MSPPAVGSALAEIVKLGVSRVTVMQDVLLDSFGSYPEYSTLTQTLNVPAISIWFNSSAVTVYE